MNASFTWITRLDFVSRIICKVSLILYSSCLWNWLVPGVVLLFEELLKKVLTSSPNMCYLFYGYFDCGDIKCGY